MRRSVNGSINGSRKADGKRRLATKNGTSFGRREDESYPELSRIGRGAGGSGSLCGRNDLSCRSRTNDDCRCRYSAAEVLATRYKDINPDIDLTVLPVYLKDENIPELLDVGKYDFIVDAIDTISPKCFLIYEAMKRRIRIVSSMGAGAKSDITQVRFADLWDTYHCGLSKAVRKRLQKMGMKRKLPVVFSTEQADAKAVLLTDDEQNKKSTCGTVSYMPAVFGCYLAEYVIKRL